MSVFDIRQAMTVAKIPIRLKLGWCGLPRGTDLSPASDIARDLIKRGIAEPRDPECFAHNAGLNVY